MIIMAPKDENECRQMLHTAYVYPGPAAVRYPRGSGLGVDVQQEMSLLELGRAELLAEFNPHHEQQISILAFGSRVQAALEAGQELAAAHKLGVRVVNMRFVKPLDEEIIQQLAGQTTLFVTVEEHAVMGGAGSAVNEFLAKALLVKPVLNLGLADSFMPQASHAQMLEESGLDALGIQRSIAQCWAKLTLHP